MMLLQLPIPLPEFRRERTTEWILAAATLGWGISALIDMLHPLGGRHTMDSPFFAPLLASGVNQYGWGVFAALVGFAHLAALYVNGRRPRGSTLARAIGSALATFFWGSLLAGVLTLPWRSGAIYSFGALVAVGAFSIFYAAREVPPVFDRARATADVQ